MSSVYKKDSFITEIALSSLFEYSTLSVISINAIWMGIESDLNSAKSIQDADMVWLVGENFFCAYFLIEILIRFTAFEYKPNCLKEGWFVFDSVLVALMVFETWIIYAFDGPSLDLGFLRLLRLLRLSRLAHLMNRVPELLTMVKGIVAAMRSVGSVLLFLAILCYVFAIVFTGAYKPIPGQTYSEQEVFLQGYFGNLGMSMFTLFVNGTLLDDLADLVTAIREDSIIVLLCFFLFILLSSFTVLNMLIGILVDVVSDTEEQERQRIKVEAVRSILTDQFSRIDKDQSGKVSQKEFEELCQDEQVLMVIEGQLGIDRTQLMQLQALLFTNSERRQKELSFEDFLKHLIRMRPEELASPMDVQQFRKVLREQERTVMRSIESLRAEMDAGMNKHKVGDQSTEQASPSHPQQLERQVSPTSGECVVEDVDEDLRVRAPPESSDAPENPEMEIPSPAAMETHAKLVADSSDFELVEELKRRFPGIPDMGL